MMWRSPNADALWRASQLEQEAIALDRHAEHCRRQAKNIRESVGNPTHAEALAADEKLRRAVSPTGRTDG